MTEREHDDLERRARTMGLGFGALLDAIHPGVESLAARLRAIGATLTPADAPPPERRDPPPVR